MELTELTLWILRLAVLAGMYLFLLMLVLALRADARAAAPSVPAVSPPPTPSARPVLPHALVVTGGTAPTTGGRFTLGDLLEIGRDPSCAVAIPNRFVSSRHLRVFPVEGAWMVQDLGSTNGSFLNEELLTAPTALTIGDRLRVGDTEFIVE